MREIGPKSIKRGSYWPARLLRAGVDKKNIDMKWMVHELTTICRMLPPENLINISKVHFGDMKRFLDEIEEPAYV